AIGSPNIISDLNRCDGPNQIAQNVTAGEWVARYAWPMDIDNTKLLICWGSNPAVSVFMFFRQWLAAKRKNNGKLISIDPRHHKTAQQADIYIPIKPGTDGAMALAMINVIINEHLYDKDFVENWTVGFDQLSDHVQRYTPEWAAKICEVPGQQIRDLARLYATTKPAILQHGIGAQISRNGVQTCRSFTILMAITGNLDVPGGNWIQKAPPGFKTNGMLFNHPDFRLPRDIEAQQIGAKEFPLWAGPDSYTLTNHNVLTIDTMLTGKPYPIKAVVVSGANGWASMPEGQRVLEAYNNMEFIAVSEYRMTPTTDYADVVLPKAHWLEYWDIDVNYQQNLLSIRQPVIPPLGEAKDDVQIFIDLSRRMVEKGYIKKSLLPWNTTKEFCEWRLKDTPYTLEELIKKQFIKFQWSYKEYEQKGFKTPSGKVELYSSEFAKHGQEPLPIWVEPGATPTKSGATPADYPLSYLGYTRHFMNLHTRFVDNPWFKKLLPEPIAELHPDTAAKHGITDGEWIWIESIHKRRIKLKAKVTTDIRPDCVSGMGGFWRPEDSDRRRGAFLHNSNWILSYEAEDPISGASRSKGGTHCKVYPVQTGDVQF
ncbi:MAG: molybdopterin-containing oxidoreductase family protein, partial [Dongiaceae bacterium]